MRYWRVQVVGWLSMILAYILTWIDKTPSQILTWIALGLFAVGFFCFAFLATRPRNGPIKPA